MLLGEDWDKYDDDLKRVRLYPQPVFEDESIGDYYNRNNALLSQDGQQLRVLVPFEGSWKSIHSRLDARITSSLTYVLRRRL